MFLRIISADGDTAVAEQIRVVLVDDHTMFRDGTRSILSDDPAITVVGEADTVEEGIRVVDQENPDVVVIDVRLKGGSGIDLAKTIRRNHPHVKTLVLTAYDYVQYMRAMVKAGVKGYLLKDSSGTDLVRAIHDVNEGRAALPPELGAKLFDLLADERRPSGSSPVGDLTVRELEILELIQQSSTDREIATRLGLSVKTVNTHVGHILLKLAEPNRTMAVHRAVELGLLTRHD